jgi:hypothetical protein
MFKRIQSPNKAKKTSRAETVPSLSHGLDIHDCSLHRGHGDASSVDPDVSICKLSLTRDDDKRPKEKKGPFGYDFTPFM